MEKQINFILQVYTVLLYGLIIYVECEFLLPYKGTELFSSWLIDFVILDWIYVNKMTELVKENPPKDL
jgi:hypothetical protein